MHVDLWKRECEASTQRSRTRREIEQHRMMTLGNLIGGFLLALVLVGLLDLLRLAVS